MGQDEVESLNFLAPRISFGTSPFFTEGAKVGGRGSARPAHPMPSSHFRAHLAASQALGLRALLGALGLRVLGFR